ncbi:MAG TPA: MFS transporter [Clostridiaceae bacterium]|nr:MFS transporter [Clostridiaceae bacterium]
MVNKLKRNVTVSYIYSFFMDLNITTAIWVLYLSYKGMSLIQIGLLESIFHVTSLLFELPTGAIADIYGKRFSVISGRILSVISCMLMIVSRNFIEFALSFIVSAASYNLDSGAAEALVYDSLKKLDEEKNYKRIWGNLAFLMSIAQGMAILLGGILADIRFIYAYALGTAIQGAALIVSFNFTEPPVKNTDGENETLVRQITKSIDVLKGRKVVLYLIIFSALLSSLEATVFFYGQKYFENISFTKTAIALIFAAGSLISALSSKAAYRIERLLKPERTLVLISAINVLSFLGMSIFMNLSAIFYLVSSVAGGIAYPVFSDYINSKIPSKYRATLLSLNSLCYSLIMICIFPIFGLMAEKIGFSITFGTIAVIYVPFIIFLMIKLKEHGGQHNKPE